MTEDERRMHERITRVERDVDAHLSEHIQFLNLLQKSVHEMSTAITEFSAVLKLHNQVNGFFVTVKQIGLLVIGSAAVLGALAAIGATIKYWLSLP